MSSPRYRLVTGKFYARFDERSNSHQPQPDGDTIRFVPDNPLVLSDPTKFKRFGFQGPAVTEFGISIRFEGIDALETHFSVSGSSARTLHQHLGLANDARDKLLELLGFAEVKFDDANHPNVITAAKNNPAKGFALVNGVDANGRLIGFVYAGAPGDVDPELAKLEEKGRPKGEDGHPPVLGLPSPMLAFLTPDVMKKSVNWQLIDAGLVYAELYTSLPLDLMRVIADRVRQLRASLPAGTIWPLEAVNTNRELSWNKTMNGLEDLVIFPKLFRRLSQYAADISLQQNKQQFSKWLRDEKHLLDRDDRLLLPPASQYAAPPFCEFGNLHDIIEISHESDSELTFRLAHNPEDVIVLPDSV